MPNGSLMVYTSVAEQAAPLPGVEITVLDESGAVLARLTTDASGAGIVAELPAPDASYSLDGNNRTVRPYAVYSVTARADGWQSQVLDGVQVFAGQQTVARLEFLPATRSEGSTLASTRSQEQNVEVTTIPPHVLFAGGGGSGPTPEETIPARVLTEVVIPKKITVHLGKPSANVSNVTVGFQDYIANVASSEVYPTWPEEALRANILAQISLALNRIWTEWYPSRGYSFNITGSPGYDQAYVAGRTVFAVMERLTAELFNTYVRRSGDQEPYFTEYCDGKTVTCPGMKQWGTVNRANEGKNALQILRYYYGDRVQLVTTNNIANIPSSWPGVTLKLGSTGTSVSILQRQLSRIAKDYPAFGKPEVTGTFDSATESCVKKFQKQFSLTADGLVGKATWYKISYVNCTKCKIPFQWRFRPYGGQSAMQPGIHGKRVSQHLTVNEKAPEISDAFSFAVRLSKTIVFDSGKIRLATAHLQKESNLKTVLKIKLSKSPHTRAVRVCDGAQALRCGGKHHTESQNERYRTLCQTLCISRHNTLPFFYVIKRIICPYFTDFSGKSKAAPH